MSWRRNLRVTYGALAVAAASYFATEVARDILGGWESGALTRHGDFLAYYEAAHRFLSAPSQLYTLVGPDLRDFIYPPPAILFLLPYSLLEQRSATVLWVLTGFGVLLTSACLAGRALLGMGRTPLFVLVILSSAPLYTALHNRQIDPIVVAIALLFLVFYPRLKTGAVASISVATLTKIYPATALVPLLAARGGLGILGRFLLAAATLVAASAILIPVDLWLTFKTQILDHVLGRTELTVYNQSIPAAIMRGATPPASWDYTLVDVPLSLSIVGWVPSVVALAGSAILVRRTGDWRLGFLIGLAQGPLLSSIAWGHHYLLAAPLVAYVIAREGSFLTIVAGLLAAVALMIPAWSMLEIIDRLSPFTAALFYGRYPLAIVGLSLCVVVTELVQWHRSAQPSPQ